MFTLKVFKEMLLSGEEERVAKYVGTGGTGVVLQDQCGTDYVKAQKCLKCYVEEYD